MLDKTKMRLLTAIIAATAAASSTSAFTSTRTTVQSRSRSSRQSFTSTRLAVNDDDTNSADAVSSRRSVLTAAASAIGTAALLSVSVGSPAPASARLEAVNRPDLLPSERGQ